MSELKFNLKLMKLVSFLLYFDVLLKKKEKVDEKKLLAHFALCISCNFIINERIITPEEIEILYLT